MTMIIAAVAAAVGVLGCALAAGLLWKKKLTKMWGASLLACALIVAVAGGAGVVRYVQAQQAEYGYIYLALRYLEQGQTDPAADRPGQKNRAQKGQPYEIKVHAAPFRARREKNFLEMSVPAC